MSGWTSPILPIIVSANSTIPTTTNEGYWMANVVPLASTFFTPLSALSVHILGRRISLLLTSVPFIASWIIIAFARSAEVIIIARIISGLGQSMAYTITPIYLGEISPVELRSSIGLSMTVVNNMGMLWIYVIGVEVNIWISSILNLIPSVVFILFFMFVPETPHFLIKKENHGEGIAVLKRLRQGDVETEYAILKQSVIHISLTESFKELYRERRHQRALLISTATHFISQFTGGITFMFFAHIIFQKAGSVSPNILSIIKQVLQLLSAILSVFIVGKTGNRLLLIISCVGSSVFMAAEAIYFYLHDNDFNVDDIWWLPLVAMILFNMFQMIGIQPIPIAFMGELFDSKVKPLAVCISKISLALSIFLVGEVFQLLMDNFGSSVPFFVFSVFGIIGVIFVYFCVPETRGRRLEEIQYYFKHNKYESKI